MPAPSLFHLATQKCMTDYRKIWDVGNAPYHIVRPFLIKVTDAVQLREIEKVSPQICGDDAEIWRALIKRDVRMGETKIIEPRNPENWCKVYRKLRREAEEELRQQKEALRAALSSQTAEKQGNQMTFVDKMVPSKKVGQSRVATTARKTGNSSLLTFNTGSRTKMGSGKDMLERARREAREASLRGRGVLNTPTHLLQSRTGQVRTVPKALAVVPPAPTAVPSRSTPSSQREDRRPTSNNEPKTMYSVPRVASSRPSPPRKLPNSSPSPQRSRPVGTKSINPPQIIGKKRKAIDFMLTPKR